MKLIDGTESLKSYAVICRTPDGTYEMGIQPLIAATSDSLILGGRLRVVANLDSEVPVISTENGIQGAFPNMQLPNLDNSRGSTVMEARFYYKPDTIKAFIRTMREAKMEQFLINWIKASCTYPLVDEDEVVEWLKGIFDIQLIKLQSHVLEAQEEANLQVVPEGGAVH